MSRKLQYNQFIRIENTRFREFTSGGGVVVMKRKNNRVIGPRTLHLVSTDPSDDLDNPDWERAWHNGRVYMVRSVDVMEVQYKLVSDLKPARRQALRDAYPNITADTEIIIIKFEEVAERDKVHEVYDLTAIQKIAFDDAVVEEVVGGDLQPEKPA